jgi:hypothetical protein
MAKKFSGLSRGRTRSGKWGLGRRTAASSGLTAKRRMTNREQFAAVIERVKATKKAARTQAKRPPMPTGLMAASIKRKIEKLRKKESWSFRERHGRTDFYQYLDAVYRAQDWHEHTDSKRWARKVAAAYEIKSRKNNHPIRTIIDASSDQNRQVKSDWSRTLEYALAEKVRKCDFLEFLRTIGGPAGFKTKMAARKKGRAKKQGW